MTAAPDIVTSLERLEAIYGAPNPRAVAKQLDRLDGHCRAFIAASPFLVLATSGLGGGDCSPRGDQPGFVAVEDDHTLLLPDRRGNNRIDSLRNIVENPKLALLFLVPGVDETLRVNGRAVISVAPALLARFAVDGKEPRSVLRITVEDAYIQCARALVRGHLWDPAARIPRDALPSLGTMLAAHTRGLVEAHRYDAEAAVTVPQTLY